MRKKLLFILDPLSKLDLEWDTSLTLAGYFFHQKDGVWFCEDKDFSYENASVRVIARRVMGQKDLRFTFFKKESLPANFFDIIFIRKEPPFDAGYLYLTYLLELVPKTLIINHPRGLRDANEKLSSLYFPHLLPKSLISANVNEILRFQKNLKKNIVLKPLHEKGGKDVVRISSRKDVLKHAGRLFKKYKTFLQAQEFIPGGPEKRILLLNGDFLSAYEKRPLGTDFRGNLGLGATFHPTELTSRDQTILRALKPYLTKNRLFFTGIDVLGPYLLEINVTCPAGIPESLQLYPELKVLERCSAFFEEQLKLFRRRA